jgi:hypothetical protein
MTSNPSLPSKKSPTSPNREKNLEHLKLMIDVQRHIAILSFAGLMFITNISTRLFNPPIARELAIFSSVCFLITIISSVLSQLNHVGASTHQQIYDYPLKNGFVIPIALTISGLSMGVIFLVVFTIINWYGVS